MRCCYALHGRKVGLVGRACADPAEAPPQASPPTGQLSAEQGWPPKAEPCKGGGLVLEEAGTARLPVLHRPKRRIPTPKVAQGDVS